MKIKKVEWCRAWVRVRQHWEYVVPQEKIQIEKEAKQVHCLLSDSFMCKSRTLYEVQMENGLKMYWRK